MALMIPRAGALEQEGLQPPAMSHLVSARGPAHMVLDAGARAYQPLGVQGGLIGEAVPPQPPDIKRRDELDPDWDNHVHAFKRQYLYIAIAYATPCFCIFMYSVFKSILYRGWWNTSAGEPYMPHSMNEQNPYRAYIGIPSVLEMHMWFACMMLAAICVQLGSMWMAVHTGIDAYGKFHAMFGKVTMFVIILAAGLGTIGLGVCDVQPKRGAENLFFVGIGVGILVCLFRGVYVASGGFYGLHFQYMAAAVVLIFSPGWNRIIAVILRNYVWLWRHIDQECFIINSWGQRGFLYFWSFLAGMSFEFFWWLGVFRAPFFKANSIGFAVHVVLAAILFACAWQTFYASAVHGEPLTTQQCTAEDYQDWKNFTSGVRTQGLYSLSRGYGVCSANLWQSPPGTFVHYGGGEYSVFRLMNHPQDPVVDVGYN
mmetsp:Transcript_97444/g.275697  ORF Transcript_97444/g.275697 Transcript_97444/m.275697 type:complete len:427 (+) Transcript_97444:101-1381(+)